MNFATVTAAQVCNVAIIFFSALWLFLVICGIVGSAIACWQDINRKPSLVAVSAARHYVFPLTCELPAAPSPAVIERLVTVAEAEEQEPQAASEAVTLAPKVAQEPQAPQSTKRLTYAQQVKAEFTEFFKMPITTKADVRSAIINRSGVSFMQAVNLERTGNDFYRAAQNHLNRIKAAKQARLEQSA